MGRPLARDAVCDALGRRRPGGGVRGKYWREGLMHCRDDLRQGVPVTLQIEAHRRDIAFMIERGGGGAGHVGTEAQPLQMLHSK